jgi:hypothetical protein
MLSILKQELRNIVYKVIQVNVATAVRRANSEEVKQRDVLFVRSCRSIQFQLPSQLQKQYHQVDL